MNIKVKAGLEVAGALAGIVTIVAGVRLGLDKLASIYSPEQVVSGISFALTAVAAYVIVGLLYDYRVNELKMKQKLEEMTKK